jgi:hypothetical protein
MRRVLALVQIGGLLAPLAGCYDGAAMVARISRRVSDDHREEVDLGRYEVTLPRSDDDPVATTLNLEVVATVHRDNASALKRQLAAVETRLRHATILALRKTNRNELLEPKLQSLHDRVEATTEELLTAASIESIAFRSFAVYED